MFCFFKKNSPKSRCKDNLFCESNLGFKTPFKNAFFRKNLRTFSFCFSFLLVFGPAVAGSPAQVGSRSLLPTRTGPDTSAQRQACQQSPPPLALLDLGPAAAAAGAQARLLPVHSHRQNGPTRQAVFPNFRPLLADGTAAALFPAHPRAKREWSRAIKGLSPFAPQPSRCPSTVATPCPSSHPRVEPP